MIRRSNIQSDVLVINQCDADKTEKFAFLNKAGESCTARIIHTTERGLSRSRNMAIRNATGDLCLFCDDDIELEDQYVSSIVDAFQNYPDKSIIAFRIKYFKKECSLETKKINIFNAAKISSVQIVFDRNKISHEILFCEKMGSGTGNGGGEENKFLVDCIKAGHKVLYVPSLIATVNQTQSLWFNGFDKRYWLNRGWVAKMIYGYFLGYVYIWYTIIFRANQIDQENSWLNHISWLHKGFFESR